MIDVFLRWYPQNDLRSALAEAVKARLDQYHGIEWYIVPTTKILHRPFHIASKEHAENVSGSPIYCVIDDDQLPLSDDFFIRGKQTLENHPEYGMLAGFPLEYMRHGEPYAACKDEVIEAHSIGCPYFVRKGTLSFPDGPLHQYDGILSKVVTDQGLKTGLLRYCIYNHLGFGFSQVEHANVG